MNPKHPPGPPMTLGNMRELGVRGLYGLRLPHLQASVKKEEMVMLGIIWRKATGAKASILILLVLVLCSGKSAAQVARIEYYPVPSVTLTDTEFLQGKKVGPAVTLAGELRIPKPGSDRLPAVVLVHGSGGIGGTGGNDDEWSNQLNASGIATFAVDSFAARGIVQTATNQSLLGRLAMIPNVYRALELLSKHARIVIRHA